MKLRQARKILSSGRRHRRATHRAAKTRLWKSRLFKDFCLLTKAGTATIGELRASLARQWPGWAVEDAGR